jgi:hypothetical protein
MRPSRLILSWRKIKNFENQAIFDPPKSRISRTQKIVSLDREIERLFGIKSLRTAVETIVIWALPIGNGLPGTLSVGESRGTKSSVSHASEPGLRMQA